MPQPGHTLPKASGSVGPSILPVLSLPGSCSHQQRLAARVAWEAAQRHPTGVSMVFSAQNVFLFCSSSLCNILYMNNTGPGVWKESLASQTCGDTNLERAPEEGRHPVVWPGLGSRMRYLLFLRKEGSIQVKAGARVPETVGSHEFKWQDSVIQPQARERVFRPRLPRKLSRSG